MRRTLLSLTAEEPWRFLNSSKGLNGSRYLLWAPTTSLVNNLQHFSMPMTSQDSKLTYISMIVEGLQQRRSWAFLVEDWLYPRPFQRDRWPICLVHTLTRNEAQILGWVFHVTDSSNIQSISKYGLKKDARNKGKGKGNRGRDCVHFMYHNDNSPGYIKMAPGTHVPQEYRNPGFFVLNLSYMDFNNLFLTKNGVILSM